MESMLTIQEIMRRPAFLHADIVAGEKGIGRRVRWVHVLEIANVEPYVHGEEMILTTGIPIQANMHRSGQYLQNLIRQKVSCLCIEMGEGFDRIPEIMLDIANEYDFPLIVFSKMVRFVDLTQDIHSLIINKHYLMLQDLERISREFHRMTLSSQGLTNILKLLHKSTKSQVVYLPTDKEMFIYMPQRSEQEQLSILTKLHAWIVTLPTTGEGAPYQSKLDHKFILAQPVGALGKTWAYTILLLDNEPHERDRLILDSASLSIAQDSLRKRYMEERKLYTKNLWVDDLLHDRIKNLEQLQSFIDLDDYERVDATYQVCTIELNMKSEDRIALEWEESAGIHLSLMLRASFEQYGFKPLMTLQNNRLVILVIHQTNHRLESADSRLRKVFEQHMDSNFDEKFGKLKLTIGIGLTYTNLMKTHISFQESNQALMMQSMLHSSILFFDELGVYQLLFQIQDKSVLEAFVNRNLGPVIEHDRLKGSDLLRTLYIYLCHDTSKQESAKQLYIVRQSLYYRLKKLAELLGADYLTADKKLALQVALRAYQLLWPDQPSFTTKEE